MYMYVVILINFDLVIWDEGKKLGEADVVKWFQCSEINGEWKDFQFIQI